MKYAISAAVAALVASCLTYSYFYFTATLLYCYPSETGAKCAGQEIPERIDGVVVRLYEFK